MGAVTPFIESVEYDKCVHQAGDEAAEKENEKYITNGSRETEFTE
jgi:hypothetical protein